MVRTVARLARMLERPSTDLSLPQYRVLAMVAAGDERATRLGSRLELAKPTITAMVEALVERGLLRRDVVEGDRRAVSLQITDEGASTLAEAEAAMVRRLAPYIERLPEADRRIVLESFVLMQGALDAAATSTAPVS